MKPLEHGTVLLFSYHLFPYLYCVEYFGQLPPRPRFVTLGSTESENL